MVWTVVRLIFSSLSGASMTPQEDKVRINNLPFDSLASLALFPRSAGAQGVFRCVREQVLVFPLSPCPPSGRRGRPWEARFGGWDKRLLLWGTKNVGWILAVRKNKIPKKELKNSL